MTGTDRRPGPTGASSVLPPVPAGITPYLAGYSRETPLPLALVRDPVRDRLAYADETPYDRDSWGTLWTRTAMPPRGRRGSPRPRAVHPYRQRRAMLDLWCPICKQPVDPGYTGPYLFLRRAEGGPVCEGEHTGSPPLHLPCAAVAVQVCPDLRDCWTAAWARHAPYWGVTGDVHDPRTLAPRAVRVEIQAESSAVRWTVAHRMLVELQHVTPLSRAALESEWARLGRERLEHEFARIAALTGAVRNPPGAGAAAPGGTGWSSDATKGPPAPSGPCGRGTAGPSPRPGRG
ncbi:hypothetical protein [Streptomyces sp. PsTaAH-124]|uniref:hypothetical protein n=1 Tax=Streptomyces sp. PsTaAH-124 TaxID=1157638 RepID=UPI0003610593|nr:hypothetical protein [Streptomyces sp. PsTaAH-124]